MTDKPHCYRQPCPMTMGYYIGGGQHVCWLHALMLPIDFTGQQRVGLVSTMPIDSNQKKSLAMKQVVQEVRL